MSRLVDATGPDFLQKDTAIVTGAQVTTALWAQVATLGNNQILWWCGDKDAPTEAFTLGLNSSNALRWRTLSGGGSSATSGTVSANTWFHAAGAEVSTTERFCWLNGGSKATNTSTVSPIGLDRTAIGMQRDSTPSREWDGLIAHVAVWNVVLTDLEIAILAAGVHPLRVRRNALIGYWPLNGQSPEYDVMGTGINLTLTGTTVANEPTTLFGNHIVAPG